MCFLPVSTRHFTDTFLHDKFQGVHNTDTEYKKQECSFTQLSHLGSYQTWKEIGFLPVITQKFDPNFLTSKNVGFASTDPVR